MPHMPWTRSKNKIAPPPNAVTRAHRAELKRKELAKSLLPALIAKGLGPEEAATEAMKYAAAMELK